MTVAVRGGVPPKWDNSTARHITERLQALERAIAGGGDGFTAPGLPPFGPGGPPGAPGTPGAPGEPGAPGAPGLTDHGDLTGLDDKEDHPQYVLHEEQAKPQPHVHLAVDVLGTEQEHPRRGEDIRALPHSHVLNDLADYGQWEQDLWRRVHEGLYGG